MQKPAPLLLDVFTLIGKHVERAIPFSWLDFGWQYGSYLYKHNTAATGPLLDIFVDKNACQEFMGLRFKYALQTLVDIFDIGGGPLGQCARSGTPLRAVLDFLATEGGQRQSSGPPLHVRCRNYDVRALAG